MIAPSPVTQNYSAMVEQNLSVARTIASRLKQRYSWLDPEDLYSYSLLGLTIAARAWRSAFGLSFAAFANHKAMYLAIDQMRQDHVLQRESPRCPREIALFGHAAEVSRPQYDSVDPHGQDAERGVGMRDQLDQLVRDLRISDQRLLAMYYTDGLSFTEIGALSGRTHNSVFTRHTVVLKLLRRKAGIAAQHDGRRGARPRLSQPHLPIKCKTEGLT